MIRKEIRHSQDLTSQYDYIIVGSGAAGSVLAFELARLQAGRVLLVEEGYRAGHSQSRRPALYPHLFLNAKLSHVDRTIPQLHLAGRSVLLPSGKGLGGSSLLNAMILCPPHSSDLFRWHAKLGTGWEPEVFSTLLDRLYQLLSSHVERQPEIHPISQRILHAMESSSSTRAIFPFVRLLRRGKRDSIWRVLAGKESNNRVDVLRGCGVQRIVFSGTRAIGLDVLPSTDGVSNPDSTFTLRAQKGIVLCAGALKTPIVLMRSGVGPREDNKMHRAFVVDSPWVGKNLSDHLVFPITLSSRLPGLPSHFDQDANRQWLKNGSGSLASNIAELGAFGWSDGESYTLANTQSKKSPSFQWHITPTHYLEYPQKQPSTNAVSVGITLLHPESRGEIQWTSDGSFRIDPSYLSNMTDLDRLISMVQWTRDWIKECPWRSFLIDEIIPGPRRSSDESVRATIKRLASTIYHYVGTSSVGTTKDSVCDPAFRIRGCEGLYVCDGSSLPDQVSGNPQVSVMLFAMKLAREISGASISE